MSLHSILMNNIPQTSAVASTASSHPTPVAPTHTPAVTASHTPKIQTSSNQGTSSAAAVNNDQVRFRE